MHIIYTILKVLLKFQLTVMGGAVFITSYSYCLTLMSENWNSILFHYIFLLTIHRIRMIEKYILPSIIILCKIAKVIDRLQGRDCLFALLSVLNCEPLFLISL